MPSTIDFDRLEIMVVCSCVCVSCQTKRIRPYCTVFLCAPSQVPPVGHGSYKTVYKALLDRSKPVAALAIRAASSRLALAEVAMLHQIKNHPNLPVLYGVARDNSDAVWLVQEYFPLGSLDMQLEVWEGMLSVTTRLCILQQVCEAMMSLRLQGVLHRDLSTRNILVHSLHESSVLDVWVKVSDFGLACALEQDVDDSKVRREDGDDLPIPWRWTAPEVYLENCWYWKSDVWSFGVTTWEVFTFARIPYLDMSDDELQRQVFVHGHRLPPPALCPAGVYALMQKCWSSKPVDRPSWSDIADILALLENNEEDPESCRCL
jgi:tyrosine-protein kinase Srms